MLGIDGSLVYAGAWTLERAAARPPRGAPRRGRAPPARRGRGVGATFVDVYAASGIVLASTRRASDAATAWLVAHRPEAAPLSSG